MGSQQSFNVLVACHDVMDVGGINTGKLHWLDIERESRRLAPVECANCSITFHTMDIKHPEEPDIFDYMNWYIQSNHQFFDVIFLPDCSGKWWEVQQSEQKIKCEDLFALLVPSLWMLKPGGFLYVGKFVNRGCSQEDFVTFLKEQDIVRNASVTWIAMSHDQTVKVPHVLIQSRS